MINSIYSKIILLSCLCLLFIGNFSKAQTLLDRDETAMVVNAITQGYNDWQTVSISGKLKMKGLPLSPSVKIYMEKDSLLIISFRAPFVGEAGRAEITSDSVLAVNRMKKVYFKESLQDFMKYYPGTVGDLQELILGRIMIPGNGSDLVSAQDDLEIYIQEEELAVIPGEGLQVEGFGYGYLLYPDGRPKMLLVVPDLQPDITVTVGYEYLKKGYDLNLTYEAKNQNGTYQYITAQMELDQPLFGGDPIMPMSLSNKFRRITPAAFLSSF